MKKILLPLSICLLVSACATPVTMMKNPKTGQVQACGGNSTASITGGAIGYHYQLKDDEKCVKNYKAEGFKVIQTPADDTTKN